MKNLKISEYITLKELGYIAGETLVFPLGMNLFLVPIDLYSSRFLGVAQMLRNLLTFLGIRAENIDVEGNFELRRKF